MSKVHERLQSIRLVRVDGYPLPTEKTIDVAYDVTTSFIPQIINPAPNGGVSLEYTNYEQRTLVEILNDDSIVVVDKKNNRVTVKTFGIDDILTVISYLIMKGV